MLVSSICQCVCLVSGNFMFAFFVWIVFVWKKRCETPQTAGGLRVLLEDCEPDLWAGLIWNPSWVAGFDPSTGFPMQSWSKMKMFGIGASLGRGCPLFRHLFCYAQNLGEGSATLELWKGKLTTNVMKMAKKFWRLRVTLIVFLPTPPGVGGRGPGKKECQYLWRKKKSPTWGGVSQWLYDCLMAKWVPSCRDPKSQSNNFSQIKKDQKW